jgi:hypothetical protein
VNVIDFKKRIVLQHKVNRTFISIDKKMFSSSPKEKIPGSLAKQHPVTLNWFETIEQFPVHLDDFFEPADDVQNKQ